MNLDLSIVCAIIVYRTNTYLLKQLYEMNLMKNENLTVGEKKIYETFVKYNGVKSDTKFKITDQRIIFEKKTGVFLRKYKIVDTINIEDIKISNRKASIRSDNLTVIIETKDRLYSFTCGSIAEARKIESEIVKLMKDSNLLEITSNKVVQFSKGISKTAGAIGGAVASVGIAAATINKNKKEIAKAIKTVKDVIKK